MPVGLHTKCAPVLVSEPTRNGGDIDAALDANRREQMTKIVVRDAPHPNFRRCVRHAVLTLEHPHDARIGRFVGTFLPQFN